MPKPLDFTDVFIALLPEGSLWELNETEFVYGVETQGALKFENDVIRVGSPSPTWTTYSGETIKIAGTSLNDGTYRVVSAYHQGPFLYITVSVSLTYEVFSGTATVTRAISAGNLKRLLMGCGDNHQALYEFLGTLAFIRDPKNTPILSDLEKEYGLLEDTGLTEAERRDRLHSLVYAPRGTGAASYLQEQLQAAGFTVYAYPNSPAADPGSVIGGFGGGMVVNSQVYDRTGTEAAKNRNLWPFVFFVGGVAITDSDGRILHIENLALTPAQADVTRELVLKCKPVHSWAVVVVNDWDFFTLAPGDTAVIDTAKGFESEDGLTGGFWWDVRGSGWTVLVVDDATGDYLVDDATGAYLTEVMT